jgi:hypothetical protein
MSSRELAALRSEWYDRLAATGFVDLEPRDNPDGPLPGFAGSGAICLDGREEYYRMAWQAVHEPEFRRRFTARQRRIIRLHLGTRDGRPLGIREIRRRTHRWNNAVVRDIAAFKDWLRQRMGFLPTAVVREVARAELPVKLTRKGSSRAQSCSA